MTPRLTLVPGGGGATPPDDDARIAAELRAMLAPPRGAADVAALEARILAAVRPDDPTPLLASWARPALVAAAAALLVAAGTEFALRQRESRMAVMGAIGVPASAVESALRDDAQREATLRQVLEP